MKRNFARHLEIIGEKTIVFVPSSRIVDQMFCFRNEHFLLEKPNKHVLHKNLDNFFHMFPGTNYGNTLLIDDMPHKSMFNPPFSAIFLHTFYSSRTNNNYLLKIVLSYLESLHSFGMWVSKFLECNPFGNITHVLLSNPWCEKLALQYSSKCHDIFCNRMKLKLGNFF